jgi:protein phosphatase
VRLVSGSSSHTGLIRGNNEDSFLVDDDHVLFAVADGMGGHRGGEVASRTAIEALRAAIAAGRGVQDAITTANDAVIERARGDSGLTGMGTTMTALVVKGGRQLLIGHVGDSRAYMLHEGVLRRITDDHSLVEELVREGRLTPEQADAHPQRHVVTRALGVDEQVDVDLYTLDVTEGDRVVLCSDGLTTMVRERDVERIARSEPDPQRAAEQLVDAANAAGGEDNTSVVVIDVLEVDPVSVFDADEVPETPSPARVMAPAPDVPEPVVREPRPSWSRRIGSALLLFVPLVLVLAIAVGGVGWYARRTYYVGFAGNRVVIYKGVPGGVLGWDPTIDKTTGITASQLTQLDHDRVAAGAARGSLGDAQRFVARLEAAADATSTTTTTTRPVRPTTTVRRGPPSTGPTRPAGTGR